MKNITTFALVVSSLLFMSFGSMDNGISLSRKRTNHNTAHKYYVSVSNITYNKQAKSLQMITRFFTDDLEDALSAREDREITLDRNTDLKSIQPILERYLDKKLNITIDKNASRYQLLGSEIDADQILLYIEIPCEQPPSNISMTFTALTELFEDQKNMVHIHINEIRKTLLMHLNKKTDNANFTLKS